MLGGTVRLCNKHYGKSLSAAMALEAFSISHAVRKMLNHPEFVSRCLETLSRVRSFPPADSSWRPTLASDDSEKAGKMQRHASKMAGRDDAEYRH